MPNENQYHHNSEYDRRLGVLESWRITHDAWAGEKAERLTRLEEQMRDMREFREGLRKLGYFAAAQTLVLVGLIISVWVKH